MTERERAVLARIARAGVMLDTRIKGADEPPSAEWLGSMDACAAASLLLQRTVEGLSVAAISYNWLMWLSYPVKALEQLVQGFDETVALGILAPLIAVRGARRRSDDH